MLDLPGKFIGILMAFFLCVIAPLVNITTTQELVARRQIITAATNLLDEVVDSRELTPEMRRQFVAEVNSYGATVNYELVKEVPTTDSLAGNYGGEILGGELVDSSASTRYIRVPITYGRTETEMEIEGEKYTGTTDASNIIAFDTGDRVGIKIYGISLSGSQYLAHLLTGVFLPDFEYTLIERVR